MRKVTVVHEQINPEKTRTALHHAIEEVQHAARPGRRSPSNLLSWCVAIGAGAAVAWRSFSAANSTDISDSATPPVGLGDTHDDIAVAHDAIKRSGEKTEDIDSRQGRKTGSPPRSNGDGKRSKGDTIETGSSRSRRGRDERNTTDRPAKVEGFAGLAKELWSRFQSAECMTRSQALAFIGVLSLGPVLLFALAALGFVIHDTSQVQKFVHDLVGQLLPGRQASEAANNLIAQTHIMESAQSLMKGKWWAVAIGVVSLLWAAVGLFVGASDPMNATWGVNESRSFIKLRTVALGVFIGAGILFLLSLVPSSLPVLMGRIQLPLVGSLPPGAWWIDLLGWLLAIVVDAAMFTVIYHFLPNVPVTWKAALFGGVVAGVMWELFKKGFAIHLAHFGDYNKIYGALGGAVLLVTWIWYSCVLLLVGAILCKMYHEHAEEGGVRQSDSAQPDAA